VLVTVVARGYGVARRTVHEWLRRYAGEGLGALADRSSRPGVAGSLRYTRQQPPNWARNSRLISHPAIMTRRCDMANFCSHEEAGGGRRRGSSAGTGEILRDVGDILYLRR
jgi:hypothetical protein